MIDYPTEPPARPMQGRRVLDLAEGILVGIRRCRPEDAFNEFLDVAKQYDLSVFTVTSALVALATRDDTGAAPPNTGAALAAARQWGELLGGPQQHTELDSLGSVR